MKKLTSHILAALLFAPIAVPASASGVPFMQLPAAPSATDVIPVAGDCYAIGQQIAAQNGGTLASAASQNRGGQNVCHIVVLVPAKDGQRPRRVEVTVPQ